jgi:uncharacterized caspase-like protein
MKALAAVAVLLVMCVPRESVRAQQSFPLDNYLVQQPVPRIALAIGVQNYDHLDVVPNALNDLAVAASALRRAGFTTVIEEPDATGSRLRASIKQLVQLVDRTERPAVVAIFFAGHGFQDGADNFIVPKDARPASIVDDSVPVMNVVFGLAPRKIGVTYLFLDACRTFTLLTQAAGADESAPAVRGGFSPVGSVNGTVLSFAPGFNQAALSRAHEGDVNSPYSEALGLHLSTEHTSVATMLSEVYTHVTIRTGDRQQPAQSVQASTATIQFVPPTSSADLEAEDRHWRAVLATNRADCVKRFLISYPDSRFAVAALRWLDETSAPSSHQPGGDPCPHR